MGQEIERKFLLVNDEWRGLAQGELYRQGYLSTEKENIVRVRTMDDKGFLTVKGLTVGAKRKEFEYEIPTTDANEMLEHLCKKPILEKIRHRITIGDAVWEVDEFLGENEGLIVAELELAFEEQTFDKPIWIGDEVTGDPKYFSSNLIKQPFPTWQQ